MRIQSFLLPIISEVLLWGILLALFYYLDISFHWVHLPGQPTGQEITLYFQDVSQLIAGSPVKFMGTDVGYVSRVEPIGREVEVKIHTYRHAPRIPVGSSFTIEFNGLAGAKSLEILPIADDKGRLLTHKAIVEEPIRLKDVFNTQMETAEALKISMENIARSLHQFKNQKALEDRLLQANHQIDNGRQLLSHTWMMAQSMVTRFNDQTSRLTTGIHSFHHTVHLFDMTTRQPQFNQQVLGTLNVAIQQTHQVNLVFQSALQSAAPRQMVGAFVSFNRQFVGQNESISQKLPRMMTRYFGLNNALAQFDQFLSCWEASIDPQKIHLGIQQAKLQTDQLAKRTSKLNTLIPKSP